MSDLKTVSTGDLMRSESARADDGHAAIPN